MRVWKGRLDLLLDPEAWRRDLLDHGLIEIPIDGAIASHAGLLAKIHGIRRTGSSWPPRSRGTA